MGRKTLHIRAFRPINIEVAELAPGYSGWVFCLGWSGGRRPALYSA
jgi:hypothetical protein